MSDEHKTVARAYCVLYPLVGIARRTSFVIDMQGMIRKIQTGAEASDPGHTLAAFSLTNPRQ